MPKSKKVRLKIFPLTVYVVVSDTLDEGFSYVNSTLGGNIHGDYSSFMAFTAKSGSQIYVVLSREFKDKIDGVFAHEITHATLEALRYSDIPINYENSELICYLNQFLTNKFLKFVKSAL